VFILLQLLSIEQLAICEGGNLNLTENGAMLLVGRGLDQMVMYQQIQNPSLIGIDENGEGTYSVLVTDVKHLYCYCKTHLLL
jgi:hypothetical protein